MHLPTLRFRGLARWALAFVLCTSAQAQTGPQATWRTFASQEERPSDQIQPGITKLILMRSPDNQDGSLPADILVDGRYLTSLLPGGFAEVVVCPGARLLELAGQGTSGLNFRPRLGLEAAQDRTTYVLVQAPSAETPLSANIPVAQAEVLLQALRRQSHAISRVPAPLNCALPLATAHLSQLVVPDAPLPSAPAPASEPTPPLPVANEPKKYTLSAEMLFAFGGSQPKHLAERGRREIVTLAQQLAKGLLPSDQVSVQGHTDPMGSVALNQRLSEERADTVRHILLTQGIAAHQVRAQGLGGSQLLVKGCAKLHAKRDDRIACDLPNRRVEITVAPLKN